MMELNEWRGLGIGHPPAYGNEKLAHQVIDEMRKRAERAEEALRAAEAECAKWRAIAVDDLDEADANDATRARLGLKPIGEAKQ